jgi:ribonuclease Z
MEVFFFGTAGARSYAERDNTYLGVLVGGQAILIDCAGAPVQRAEATGFPWRELRAVVLTHLHPDHWYGLTSLIHNQHLAGRKEPLEVLCLEQDASRVANLLDVFGLAGSADHEPLAVIRGISGTQLAPALDTAAYEVRLFPARHSVPCLGVRIEEKQHGAVMVYSSDTWRSEQLVAAAMDADLLVHEASFLDERLPLARELGHSTAGEAGRIAKRCRARRLALVHFYRDDEREIASFRDEASREFGGEVQIPADLGRITVP